MDILEAIDGKGSDIHGGNDRLAVKLEEGSRD